MASPFTENTSVRIPTKVSGLWQVDFGFPGERFWCGALRFSKQGQDSSQTQLHQGKVVTQGGVPVTVFKSPTFVSFGKSAFDPTTQGVQDSLPDGLFYLQETSANNKIILDPVPLITRADGHFSFLPYRLSDELNKLQNVFGLVVNGFDNVIKIGRGTVSATGLVRPIFGYFIPNNAFLESNGAVSPRIASVVDGGVLSDRATFAIQGINAITEWQGSVCYGGFTFFDPSEGVNVGLEDFSHFICFSDVTTSPHGMYSVDISSTIQIGDSPSEPVVALAKNTIVTDIVNAKGQLLVFTPRRVTVIEGVPPLPGLEVDQSFRSDVLGNVGTWAPRSVVRTPIGVVFLGSDGMVYLIPQKGLPVRIGRPLQPHFEKLSPLQMKQACAVYHRDHYILSIPNPEDNGLTNVELWTADLRAESLVDGTGGVRWFGPHPNHRISVFARGLALGDSMRLMGGSSISTQIFDMWRDDLNTIPPLRTTQTDDMSDQLSEQQKIKTRFVTNLIDVGDIHTDKIVRNLRVRLKTDNVVDVTLAVSVASIDTDNGELTVAAEEFTEEVRPGYGQLGTGSDDEGGQQTYPSEGFEVVSKYPTTTLRGRAITVEFREEASANGDKDPKVSVSDLSIEVEELRRD